MKQKHSQQPPHATLKGSVWRVEWPPDAEGDYLVADVDGETWQPGGCVMYSLKPFYGPIPKNAKPNMPNENLN